MRKKIIISVLFIVTVSSSLLIYHILESKKTKEENIIHFWQSKESQLDPFDGNYNSKTFKKFKIHIIACRKKLKEQELYVVENVYNTIDNKYTDEDKQINITAKKLYQIMKEQNKQQDLTIKIVNRAVKKYKKCTGEFKKNISETEKQEFTSTIKKSKPKDLLKLYYSIG